MSSNKRFFFVGLFFLVAFTFFSWGIKRGALRGVDFAFSVKVQDAIDRSARLRTAALVGEVMEGSTFFASPEFSVVVVLLLTGWAAYDRKKKKIRWQALVIPIAFTLLIGAELYGKSVVHHPAPPFFMIKNPTTIFPKYYINEQFSYPSGHAARAVFLALIASSFLLSSSIFRKKRMKIVGISLFVTYVALVALSRIYLGHHWLSDIAGGILLGIGAGLVGLAVYMAQKFFHVSPVHPSH
jgi:membrane-associated phospholipid phosphatase